MGPYCVLQDSFLTSHCSLHARFRPTHGWVERRVTGKGVLTLVLVYQRCSISSRIIRETWNYLERSEKTLVLVSPLRLGIWSSVAWPQFKVQDNCHSARQPHPT